MLKNILIALLSKVSASEAYVHSTTTDPLQQFMFSVRFVGSTTDGGDAAFSGVNDCIGFQKVSGLNADLNVVEYHEGCTNYPIKLAGKASFGEVTMEKGVIPYVDNHTRLTVTTNLLDFLNNVASDGTKRFNVEIELLGRDGKIRAKYILHDAFISKWEAPDLDASSDDVAIEKVTVQYDYFTYIPGPTGTGNYTNWEPVELRSTR